MAKYCNLEVRPILNRAEILSFEVNYLVEEKNLEESAFQLLTDETPESIEL